MKFPGMYYFCCLVFMIVALFGSTANASNVEDPERKNSTVTNGLDDDVTDREPHLRLFSELKDITLTSGERVQFRCRVDAWPNDQMRYTWYKDNKIFNGDEDEYRVIIRNRPTGTKLTIKNLLTSDTGTYRCEASNGMLSVHSTAHLKVGFSLPPLDDHMTVIPTGKCEKFKGDACKSLLSGQLVYVDPFQTQEQMEEEISIALSHLNKNNVSPNCRHYAYPAFCRFVFSPCDHKLDPESGKPKAYKIKLCREDCELLKYDVCLKEYQHSDTDSYMREIFKTANCTSLPITSSSTECTKVGLPSVVDNTHRCYNDTGAGYRGVASFTRSGKLCKPWPESMVQKHKELAGGHNYCRNLAGEKSMPWCYVSDDVKEICDLEKCAEGVNLLVIVVPCVVVVLLICSVAVIVVCRKKNKKNKNAKSETTKPPNQSVASTYKTKLPEIHPSVLRLLTGIGDCQYGKVYKAQILPNPHFNTTYPVVVKTLREGFVPKDKEEFQKELQVFSELQHQNVACLKAFIFQPSSHALVFEYTDGVDLHEYLAMHSPQSDVEVVPRSDFGPGVSGIEEKDFIHMALQVATGMEYLSNKNYVHRDLAARNLLVFGNMEIKISNLGIVRDSYLSCYYTSPQGGHMLPVRWMAPESFLSWKFSDKSTVWSFGVVVWEMFSYGLQPYCGYSNHEVLDMISRRQLLSCPDHCPAKIYSLMQECWAPQLEQRPSFKELRAKLQGWDRSNADRMTSQLAQGIHKQLANVMRDGSGQYQASKSSGGSTYNSGSGSIPSQHPGSYHSSSIPEVATAIDCPPPYQTGVYQLQQMLPGPTHQYPGGYMSGGNYPTPEGHVNQQSRDNPFPKRPSSQSSRASSTCSSTNDRYTSPKQPPLKSISESRDEAQSGENRDCEEPKESYKEEQHYQEPRVMSQLQEAKLVVKTSVKDPDATQSKPLLGNRRYLDRDSSDLSTNSLKATSCDSGLPVEDVDGQMIDSTAPLISRPSLRVQVRPVPHGQNSRQNL